MPLCFPTVSLHKRVIICLTSAQALRLLHTAGARKTVQTLNFELQAVPVTYKLTYFDTPGLAETTRLCFAATGTPFEDIRLSNSEDFQVFFFCFRPAGATSPQVC